MAVWIVTAHIAKSRHGDRSFAINDLVEFEAAAFRRPTLTFAVVNDEKCVRIHGDGLVATEVLEIIAEAEAGSVSKFA